MYHSLSSLLPVSSGLLEPGKLSICKLSSGASSSSTSSAALVSQFLQMSVGVMAVVSQRVAQVQQPGTAQNHQKQELNICKQSFAQEMILGMCLFPANSMSNKASLAAVCIPAKRRVASLINIEQAFIRCQGVSLSSSFVRLRRDCIC